MTDLVLHGPAPSSYVRTARMTCLEKGLSHTLEPLDFGSALHEKLHPWKRVPILRHGAITLYETSAITRYLDEIGSGPKLVPETTAARATMEQWISAINSYVYDSFVRNYALCFITARLQNREPDLAAIRAAVPAMERDVARLDSAYAGRAWVAGDALSLADLLIAPIVQTVAMFPEGQRAVAAATNLSRAYDQLRQRDSFVKAHAGLGG